MSQILAVQLNAAKFLVGPKLSRLEGAVEDYFTISSTSDVGSIMGGIQGDVMIVNRLQNAYTASVTVMQASRAVGTLLSLVGVYFNTKVSFNDFQFNGVGVITNLGDWTASLGTLTRTFTLGLAYQSGNILTGIGAVAEV
jgi:hypothetical protein